MLTNLSFVVSAGDRVGVVGENGSGKSTLLKAISGAIIPTAGAVELSASRGTEPTTGLLHQEPPFEPNDSVDDALEAAVALSRYAAEAVVSLGQRLADEPDTPEIAVAYADALETAELLSVWEIDARIAATVSGLGLGTIDRTRLTSALSGGQRARLALACLLLSGPDVLLLDEPTNHLDDAATEYLVRTLESWRGPVLMASHDRAFLDEAATSILDLDPSPLPHAITDQLLQEGAGTGIGVTRFTGTYSEYLAAARDSRKRWEQQYRDEQAELKRLRATVKEQQTVGHSDWRPRTEVRMAQKFYADRNAKVVSRRVNDARLRLQDLEVQQIRKPPTVLEFRGLGDVSDTSEPEVRVSTVPVLTATNVTFEGRLGPISLSLSHGEKWLITGPNGSGKSTLLEILAGKIAPTGGQVTVSKGVRVKLLAQEIDLGSAAGITEGMTVEDAYIDLVGVKLAERVPLSEFGLFHGKDLGRPFSQLSMGQQRRLALAVLLADPPDVLLLDEPTNHFSLSLVSALEETLATYPGTVVIASHDRWLRKRWSDRHLSLDSEKGDHG